MPPLQRCQEPMENKQWLLCWQGIWLPSTGVGFLERRTHSLTTKGDITSVFNVMICSVLLKFTECCTLFDYQGRHYFSFQCHDLFRFVEIYRMLPLQRCQEPMENKQWLLCWQGIWLPSTGVGFLERRTHYFKDCYVEGSIDFIFGHGQSTYKRCELHPIADRRYLSGSITAQNRATPAEISGFVFIGCKITGTGHVFLGRAWGAYSRVIFADTYMANIIVPQGWDDWGLVDRHGSVDYGEY